MNTMCATQGAPACANSIPELPRLPMCGVDLHAIDEPAAIRFIIDQLAAARGGWMITPNLDHLRRACSEPDLARLYAAADLVVADGMPLIWASRLLGTPLPGRVAGSTLLSTLSAAAADAGRSIYLFGGSPGSADAAAQILCQRHPTLRIAGTCCPEIGFERDSTRLQRLVIELQAASPDIVYVGLGSPKQEQLIARIRHVLPRAWWLGVGVSFSFLAGHVRRAPLWMQRCGLEWLHRLCQEPGRLARRYLVDGLPFAAWLLATSAVEGLANRRRQRAKRQSAQVAE